MKQLRILIFLMMTFLATTLWAQSQQATIVNDGALVYKDADFDAPTIAELKAGQVFSISLKEKGPFYKIRLKQGLLGWIADNDVKVSKGKAAAQTPAAGAAVTPPKKPTSKKEAAKEKEKDKEKDSSEGAFAEKPRQKSFYATRFRGPVLSYLAYAENTMGALRTQTLPFYGMKFEGPDTMFSGDFRTDAEILLHIGAPNYYADQTGQGTDGWIFMTDFIFETAFPQSRWHMLTYGFGPMFRYSHYDVSLPNGGKPVSYGLDDMVLGAVFDGGLAFRVSKYALRFNIKYFWEKTRYWGGSLTFGFPF